MTKDELERDLNAARAKSAEKDAYIRELKAKLDDVRHVNETLRDANATLISPLERDTYAAAVSIRGKQSQVMKAVEELSELTKELSKDYFGAHNIDHISEEMADVEIMLEQLKEIFRNRAAVDRYKSMKLERLTGKLLLELTGKPAEGQGATQ